MKTLIIVDCQNDFISGTMSLKNNKNILPEIKNYIKYYKEDIEKIVFAVKWQPYNHVSFKKYGGKFNHHCIQYTPGACIEPKLLKYVQSLNIDYAVSPRNQIEEVIQDGAFAEIDYVQDSLGSRYYLDSLVEVNADSDFVICGILEGCIATIENMLQENISVSVFSPGITSPDGGKLLNNFVTNKRLEKVSYYEKFKERKSRKNKKN